MTSTTTCGGPTTSGSTPPSDTGVRRNSPNRDSSSKKPSNTPLPIQSASAHAAQYQFDRLGPRLRWDDGFRHMASIPGIPCRPAFQALPGRITQVLDHLGRGHRRGGIQVHRALSFLGAGHMIIFSFSLQENVRTL